jgi:uncharacterized protein
MKNEEAVQKTAAFIKKKFGNEPTGHDWWHMYRVWKLARYIAKNEKGADMFIVELGALLHDIADWKFHEDEEAGPKAARSWLESIGVRNPVIERIEDIIRNVSFKGAKVKNDLKTIEGRIVYDADKLDAMGAIGIGRAFAYGGANNRPMFDPGRAAVHHETFDSYKNDKTGTINHFYDKLLLLKDRMYTETGKQLARQRHAVMVAYVDRFLAEWEGVE